MLPIPALLLCFLLSILLGSSIYGQVKIGDNATTMSDASLLELETTNKGFVLPRVAITDVTLPNPLSSSLLRGTLVYNTNTGITGGSGTGMYIWNGNRWRKFATEASAWLLKGNSGIDRNNNFLGTTDNVSLPFRTNNVERLVIDSNGRIGINITTPAKRFDVNASTVGNALSSTYDYLRITNLAIDSASSGGTVFNNNYAQTLVIDTLNHLVGVSTVKNVAGQIMRIGLNGSGSSTPYATTEVPIRFNSNYTATQMGNAPNGEPNYINAITGSSFNIGVSVAPGNGAPARTTDQIVLPAGVYRLTIRITAFTNSAASYSIFIKTIVNNNEYSIQELAMGNSTKTGFTVVDDLNLGTTSTIDFTTENETGGFLPPGYGLVDKVSPGVGNSYRSLVLIEKLR